MTPCWTKVEERPFRAESGESNLPELFPVFPPTNYLTATPNG